ncbi:MAG: flippase-like domain-containing protein, partial [Actinobacteria bacterium]|nr:flippase-like domain-containing protein [Actinomycetota bacterium]
KLHRVTWGSLGMAVILMVAAYFLVSSIAGIGLDTIVEQLSEADQAWLWGALLMGVVAQFGQAFSTMGAAIMPVRFSASLALQFAIQFMALAVPSSAARVALNIRFFQRNGASAPAAITIGAIDSFSGFIIQALVVLFVLISGAFTFDLQLGGSDSGSGSGTSPLLVVTVALSVLAVAVVLAVPKYRGMLKEKLVAAKDQLRVLRSPRKLLMLFGGNLFGQLMLAVSLGMCLRAFGQHLPLGELLFINTLVALFAGFMPVPGGIGVAEAATSTCLVAAGIESSVALSTAIMFRMMTFYLPPIWGSVATRWLRKREYL